MLQQLKDLNRAQTAHKEYLDSCQDSHHALIKLVKFLDSYEFNELIQVCVEELAENSTLTRKEWIHAIIEQYMLVLEEARNAREETSNKGEEFHRALADWPPRQPGAPRILVE